MRVSPEEQVSALLDGELAGDESALVVRRVARDEELKATALRYALIGDALRGELPERGPADLVSRVRAGLAGSGPIETRGAVQRRQGQPSQLRLAGRGRA